MSNYHITTSFLVLVFPQHSQAFSLPPLSLLPTPFHLPFMIHPPSRHSTNTLTLFSPFDVLGFAQSRSVSSLTNLTELRCLIDIILGTETSGVGVPSSQGELHPVLPSK